ncbi:MAG: S-layer homology domain-containing protein, partial [Paenibacillus macerans]
EDANSGLTLSDIWGFYTGAGGSKPGSGSSGGGSKSSSSSSAATTAPVNPPAAEQPANDGVTSGVIAAAPAGNGRYEVSADQLRKAASAAANGKIEVQVKPEDAEAGRPVIVDLDAATLAQLAKERKVSLSLSAPGSQITFAQDSLRNRVGDADKLSVKLGYQAAGNSGLEKGMTSTGIAYELGLSLVKGSESADYGNLESAAEIRLTLTEEQAKLLNSAYAGVYERVNGGLRYIGGSFDGRTVTFTADHAGIYEIVELRKDFADLRGHWSEDVVRQLAAKHLIQGLDAERFAPSAPVTRADFSVVMMRVLGARPDAVVVRFTDLPPGAYYAEAVEQAASLGLVQGSGGRFRPADGITREEAAVILSKMALAMNASLTPSGQGKDFADAASISVWARDAVSQMQAAGMLNGKGNGRFEPKGSVTRAEMAKMMSEMLKLKR